MKYLFYGLLALGIPVLTYIMGTISAYMWYWGNGGQRTREDTEEVHYQLLTEWVLIIGVSAIAMIGGIFGLYKLIDIVLLLAFAVLQFNFFYEGAMFSRWNDLDSSVHTLRWKSVGTNPDTTNFQFSTRWMMFVFSLFALIILFTYQII